MVRNKDIFTSGGFMNNKRLAISLVANIVAFCVNIGINFFLTSYIVNHVGTEAYGFASLANNFTNYAAILTIALNSMAGRFITIEYEKGHIDEVQKYFSSALFANIIMCCVLLLPAILCVMFLDSFLNISVELITDVKILFGFVFLGFLITLIDATFSTSLFVVNRKDIEAKRNIGSYLLKAFVLILLYICFSPKVFCIGIGAAATAIFALLADMHFTHKYLPLVHPGRNQVSKEKIKILLSSGIWNSLTKLSNVLTDGLDLIITNLFIGSTMMGTLSVAKMIPSVITTLIGLIAGVFVPNYTIAYAHGDKKDFLFKIKQSMIVSGTISNICLVALIALGKDFFSLWVPGQDIELLEVLSILTIAGMFVNGGIQCVYNVFAVVNKIKINSLVNLATDFGIVAIVFILLKTTNLGVLAVAGVSSLVVICRSLMFSVPYASYCTGIKRWFFYKQILLNFIALAVSVLLSELIKSFFDVNSWLCLAAVGLICSILTLIISFIFTTDKSEKLSFIRIIWRKK